MERALPSLAREGWWKTESDQAHLWGELPVVSAFYNGDNCHKFLPPFEASEELAKACLPLERIGLVLGMCSVPLMKVSRIS